jgi:hypothetical protein
MSMPEASKKEKKEELQSFSLHHLSLSSHSCNKREKFLAIYRTHRHEHYRAR